MLMMKKYLIGAAGSQLIFTWIRDAVYVLFSCFAWICEQSVLSARMKLVIYIHLSGNDRNEMWCLLQRSAIWYRMILVCGHVFLSKCILPWILKHHNCPECLFAEESKLTSIIIEPGNYSSPTSPEGSRSYIAS